MEKNTWMVIEIQDRSLLKAAQFATQQEAIDYANELLKKHVKEIGYEEEFAELMDEFTDDPYADEDSSDVHIAKPGREGAWCNWHDTHWDAYVDEVPALR